MNTKQYSRIFVAILGGILLIVASLALSSVPTTSIQAQPLPLKTQSAISGTVTIWYAYNPGGSEEAAFMQVITNAKVANPGVTITTVYIPFSQIFNLYETQVLTGGGPDMFIAPNDNLGNQVRAGVIRNVDAYLQGRLTNVYTTAIDGMKVGDQLYGVPESAKAVALYYNKSQIAAPPTTTIALLSLLQSGKKLTAPTSGSYFFYGLWSAFGGQLMDENGRCIADRGGFAPAMQYLLDLQNAGAELELDYGIAQSQFASGQTNILINGPWELENLRAALGGNLGVAILPAGPVDVARSLNGIDGFYVNPNTQDITATVELALFMTNQSSSQVFTDIGGHIPIRSDVASTDPLVNIFSQVSAQGYPRPQSAEFSNYWGPFGDMVTSVLADAVSPTTGVMIACDTMNQLNGFPVFKVYLPLLRR
jgi:arabinogalactan oligomer/maltooligosaccharide transport system substrate-binding protein